MFAAIFEGLASGALSIFPKIAEVIGNTIVKRGETKAAQEGAQDLRGSEAALAWLTSVNQANEVKAKYQTEKQVLFAMTAFAAPTAFVYWAACLDSVPFYVPFFMDFAHRVGSWGIDLPPKLEQTMKDIINSYFIAAPAVAGVSVLARAFRR